MLYKFADFYIEMSPLYDYTLGMAKYFICNEDISEDKIIHIGKNITEEFCKQVKVKESHLSLGEIEHMYLAAEFFQKILDYDSIMIHASAIKYNGMCYLFSAPSKTGKSTHTKLWKKVYGNDVTIINDDKPIIRLIDGKLYAYGTPFAGGTYGFIDDRAELNSIVFVKRGLKNSIRKITAKEAIPQLFNETVRKVGKELMFKVLDMLERVINYADFYEITCNMDEEAAVLAHDTIVKDINKNCNIE